MCHSRFRSLCSFVFLCLSFVSFYLQWSCLPNDLTSSVYLSVILESFKSRLKFIKTVNIPFLMAWVKLWTCFFYVQDKPLFSSWPKNVISEVLITITVWGIQKAMSLKTKQNEKKTAKQKGFEKKLKAYLYLVERTSQDY